MAILHLNIQDAVYDRFLEALKGFTSNEVKIISTDTHFMESKNYVQDQLDEMNSGSAKYYSQNEFENIMKKEIEFYENKV